MLGCAKHMHDHYNSVARVKCPREVEPGVAVTLQVCSNIIPVYRQKSVIQFQAVRVLEGSSKPFFCGGNTHNYICVT